MLNRFTSLLFSLLILGQLRAQVVDIVRWNFQPGASPVNSPAPSFGTGIAVVYNVGGGTITPGSGVQGIDSATLCGAAVSGTNAWELNPYSPGSSNESSGVQFNMATTGYTGITVTWHQRFSNTATNTVRLKYTTDGTTWNDFNMTVSNTVFCLGSLNGGKFETSTTSLANYRRITCSFAGITAVENNPNFAIRVLGSHYQSTGQFRQHSTPTSVATGGTWRFDNVAVMGTAIPASGSVSFTQAQSISIEGNSGTQTINIPVSINSNPASNVDVSISLSAGTASSPSDFTLSTNSLTFTNGGPLTQNVQLIINGDVLFEPTETVQLTLSVTSGPGTNGSQVMHTHNIINDELPSLVINEVVRDNIPGVDNNEYIELKGLPNQNYSGWYVVELEGDIANVGVIDRVFPVGTTDANGYFVFGPGSLSVENGTITLLLVQDFVGVVGLDLDANDDGIFDITLPWTLLADDMGILASPPDLTDRVYSLTQISSGIPLVSVGGVSRIPDGFDSNGTTDWVLNDSLPGSNTPQLNEALNTPGALNLMAFYVWNGSVNSNWGMAVNWDNLAVPPVSSCASNVIIPDVVNQPVLGVSGITIGNLTLNDNATLQTNSSLGVCGNLTAGVNSAAIVTGSTGGIRMVGTAVQNIIGMLDIDYLMIVNPTSVNLNDGMGGSGVLNVNGGVQLEGGTLNTNDGQLTLKSTTDDYVAYLDFFSGSFSGTLVGSINVERFVPVSGSNQHFISSPIDNLALSSWGASGTPGYVVTSNCDETQLAVGSPYGTLFSYNEAYPAAAICAIGGWEVLTSGNAQNGKGYSVYLNGGTTYTVSGSPNLSPFYTLAGCTNSGWTNTTLQGNTKGSGWWLLGNPYISTINPLAMANDNVPLGFDAQMQVWVTNGPYTGTYQAAGVPLAPIGAIAPHQAVMVKKSAVGGVSNYSVMTSHLMNTLSTPFYKMPEISLGMEVAQGAFKDKTNVNFNTEATDLFDALYDAEKFESALGQPTLATMNVDKKMSVNALATLTQPVSVPVFYKTFVSGSATFNFDLTYVPTEVSVMLEDKETGMFLDIVSNPEYNFTAQSGTSERFVLHFLNNTSTSVKEENSNIKLFANGTDIVLNSTEVMDGILRVYNINGQLVNQFDVDKSSHRFSTNLNPQNVIAVFSSVDGEVVRKIVSLF